MDITQIGNRRTRRSASNANGATEQTGRELTQAKAGRELFVAVVGPVGAGATSAALRIRSLFENRFSGGERFSGCVIKASELIRRKSMPSIEPVTGRRRKEYDDVVRLQDQGDAMRRTDTSAVAREIVAEIRLKRSEMTGLAPGEVDGRPRIFVIDSLRHPDEVLLLRRIYGNAFALLGIVCDPDTRRTRLIHSRLDSEAKADPSKLLNIDALINRDANAQEKYGQQVTKVFELADFYVDNSDNWDAEGNTPSMNEFLERFSDILTRTRVIRPTMAETAMHHAYSAARRSACMSRQVGAALVDEQGNVVATGTNEVPRAGGGVYGEHFFAGDDSRCAFGDDPHCRNNQQQNAIIDELILALKSDLREGVDATLLAAKLRSTRLGGLIEFSRAVHAEMDAVLSAARAGVSPRGKRLFVTTFPCHYCARHLVSAGVDEVQYIEPYPKSLALKLHADAITTKVKDWRRPSRVAEDLEDMSAEDRERAGTPHALFRPFVGVAPQMYAKAFTKDRDLKDGITGKALESSAAPWGEAFELSTVHYTDMEKSLARAGDTP